ncbi:MAG: caspase family protein [Chitinophagaceae bacterium]|nr:caspase family protein [Chitinophagaceae bacterium]
MRAFFVLLFILQLPFLAFTQSSPGNSNPHVYALVVGISSYREKDIPQLRFANRDAELFAEFLRSKAGGSVPEENIILLTDSAATTGAVYDAIYDLKNKCQAGDLVYFYFSGHGDLENTTIYKNGFLICYDSPPVNYVRLSLSIDYLNDVANTLSAQTNANVVLITDACHSGKLAGSQIRGNILVGEQLRAVRNKEIRITSCATDQLSNENTDWGGGRGVFSWYLVNGLKGLADRKKDGVITIDEIKAYLESSLASDPVLKRENLVQTPVINGSAGFALSKVDPVTLRDAEQNMTANLALMVPAPVITPEAEAIPANAQSYFLSLMKKESLEELTDSLHLEERTKDEIPFLLIQQVRNKVVSEAGKNKLNELESQLRTDTVRLKKFNGKIAVAFDEKGQAVIDEYLRGDEAELERRRYYNSRNNGYDVYPKMFATAIKLTQPDNFLFKILQVKLHYFTGVTLRLKIPTVADYSTLITQAINEQEKALNLEENAAYIYNEIGVLNTYRNNFTAAETNFIKATEIAPQWAIPWSNLIGVFTQNGKLDKAQEAILKAKEILPGLQGIYVNQGNLKENQGDLLFAEELYRKSIDINSRHYMPFEKLARVLHKTTQYATADSFYNEADIRKKGYHFFADSVVYIEPNFFVDNPIPPCPVDEKDVSINDVLGHFALGAISFNEGKTAKAETEFRKVISLDPSNPLAFYYLGRIHYGKQSLEEADINFKLAVRYHLDDSAFKRYLDSMSKKLPATPSRSCIIAQFSWKKFDRMEPRFFLAKLLRERHHYTESAFWLREIISLDPTFIGAYYKLWTMLESIGRYRDAEELMKQFRTHAKDEDKAIRYLSDFYNRINRLFPDNGEWAYKAGLFFYQLAATNPGAYPLDRKIRIPDSHEEKFINHIQPSEAYPDLLFYIPGTSEIVYYPKTVNYPRDSGIYFLKKADNLLAADDEAIADINDKIGDLYVWQGLELRSISHYRKSIDRRSDQSGVRIKLIDVLDHQWFYQDALEQLDTLYHRKELNFTNRLLLAKYRVHSGRFREAQGLLDTAAVIHPYKMPGIADLNGRLQLLSGNLANALEFYKKLFDLDKKDSNVQYSISRILAKMGNKAEALNWLESAMKSGFNYSFVLKYDPYLESIRGSAEWNARMKTYGPGFKHYPPPPTSGKKIIL